MMLHKDFVSGHYQKTIYSFFEEEQVGLKPNLPSIVGSLSFAGRIFEAEKLFSQNKSLSDREELSACMFFLGLGFTRKSNYKKAKIILKENQKTLNSDSSQLQKFYVSQGIAFYLFFIGKLDFAHKWTNRSLTYALASKNLYARSLATDLLGHIKLRFGEINSGMSLLKQAAEMSYRLGNKSVTEAMEIAELHYQAHYGYSRENIVEKLDNKFSHLITEDSYSRAVVGLELVRQLTLRGQYTQGEKILENISGDIFSSENRRQEILLNLRFAEIYYQRGRNSQAWNHLRSARRCLDFEADKGFEVQILGFESKLFTDLKKADVLNHLMAISGTFSSVINQNILKRQSLLNEEYFNQEDLFHDFLISLDSENDPVKKIIESGYWSLLYKFLEVPRGQDLLYIGTGKNVLIIFSEKNIDIPSVGLTPLYLKLLLHILNGTHSKEDLCLAVWGYQYDSYRHDMMIYAALSSLRKCLGSAANWIETTDKGYTFSKERDFKIDENLGLVSQKKITNDEEPLFLNLSNDLNLRQIKILTYLKDNEVIDVNICITLFKVSEVTASRDLRVLKERKFVISIGKARATKYTLSRSHYES